MGCSNQSIRRGCFGRRVQILQSSSDLCRRVQFNNNRSIIFFLLFSGLANVRYTMSINWGVMGIVPLDSHLNDI